MQERRVLIFQLISALAMAEYFNGSTSRGCVKQQALNLELLGSKHEFPEAVAGSRTHLSEEEVTAGAELDEHLGSVLIAFQPREAEANRTLLLLRSEGGVALAGSPWQHEGRTGAATWW
jgi:hypothetical protein